VETEAGAGVLITIKCNRSIGSMRSIRSMRLSGVALEMAYVVVESWRPGSASGRA
jgi:hypothetical protein